MEVGRIAGEDADLVSADLRAADRYLAAAVDENGHAGVLIGIRTRVRADHRRAVEVDDDPVAADGDRRRLQVGGRREAVLTRTDGDRMIDHHALRQRNRLTADGGRSKATNDRKNTKNKRANVHAH